jgi:dinuclear metal center YbgI/SA1388 family protein
MITLQELCLYLNELLQIPGLNDYCKNGLQVEGCSKITKIATAVSASLETIEMAAEMGVDALIVHHGMFWNSDPHEITGVKKKKLKSLLKPDISLIAYHLPLDAHKEFGNNWKAALDMGWMDLKPFGNVTGIPIGVMGKIPDQTNLAFQEKLENYYGNKAHIALFGKEHVKTAGLVSGGAYKYIQDAVRENLDCFITGNFDEPVWNMAMEEKINFYALGHSATERIGSKALGEHLQAKFGIPCEFIDVNNPF